MTSLRSAWVWLLPAAFSALCAGGCVDVAGDFDRFKNSTDSLDLSTNEPDTGPGHIYDVSGKFLLGMATVVSPSMPVAFLTTTTLTENGDGTAALDSSLQPLSATDEHPVGSPFGEKGTKVAADGTFSINLPMVLIPADANSVTGSDLVVSVMLRGTLRSADQFCGDVTGMVNMPAPIDLTGSKWAALRVPGSGVLPPLASSCAALDSVDGGM
jgi:hypothetical protein